MTPNLSHFLFSIVLPVLFIAWIGAILFITPGGRVLRKHPAIPLLAVCLCVLLFNVACFSAAGFFVVAQAVLATIAVVLKSLSSVLSPAEEAEAQGLVGAVSSDMTLVENDITAFEADKTGTGVLATLNAGIAVLQGSLAKLEAAAGIKNQVLLNWIAVIVSSVGAAITAVVTDIIPALPAALTAHLAGDSSKLESLGDKLKTITVTMRDSHNAAADKILDPETAKAVKTLVNHAAEPHIGPIRV